jgi:hypothetical protein
MVGWEGVAVVVEEELVVADGRECHPNLVNVIQVVQGR